MNCIIRSCCHLVFFHSTPPPLPSHQYKQRRSRRHGVLISFQTLMSILKILATVKPTQLPAPKVIFLLTDLPVLRVSDVAYLFDFALRGGHMLLIVPILILLVSFSLANNGSPCHYRLFCVLFWVKILSSQLLLLFQSFILSSPPPSTFRLNISEDDHGGTVYVGLISDINECPENTHN